MSLYTSCNYRKKVFFKFESLLCHYTSCNNISRSNVAVIIVKVIFISVFLFYCLLSNHSFPTNPNRITNCFKLILFYLQSLQTTFAQCVRLFLIFESVRRIKIAKRVVSRLLRQHLLSGYRTWCSAIQRMKAQDIEQSLNKIQKEYKTIRK